jgi:hypothetical protein
MVPASTERGSAAGENVPVAPETGSAAGEWGAEAGESTTAAAPKGDAGAAGGVAAVAGGIAAVAGGIAAVAGGVAAVAGRVAAVAPRCEHAARSVMPATRVIPSRAMTPKSLSLETLSVDDLTSLASLTSHGATAEPWKTFLQSPLTVEAKRGADATDPRPQLLGGLLASAWALRARGEAVRGDLYGCFTVGTVWTFVCVSLAAKEQPPGWTMALSWSREFAVGVEGEAILQVLRGTVRAQSEP